MPKKIICKLNILVIILIVITSAIIHSEENNNKKSVYFVFGANNCNSCCQSAVKSLIKNYLTSSEFSKIIVLPKKDISLMRVLKRDLGVDSVIVNNSINSFKGISLKSDFDIIVLDNKNLILQQYTNSTIIDDFYKNLGSNILGKNYNLNQNDSIIVNSVFSPYINLISKNISFIQPFEGQIVTYKPIKEEYIQVISPSKKDCYHFYNSKTHKLEYWDQIYKFAPNSFIHYYAIYTNKNAENKVLITIIDGYDFDSLNKEVKFHQTSAILKQNEANNNKISSVNYSFTQDFGGKVSSKLNDSLRIIQLINFKDQKYHVASLNVDSDSINIFNQFDSLINIDSITYWRYGSGNNKMLAYNSKSNKLIEATFKSIDNLEIKYFNSFVKNNWASSVFDIYTENNKLYFIFINSNISEYVYIEEYDIDKLNFIRGYSLDIKADEAEILNIAGILNDSLFVFFKNMEGNWFLKSYGIL